MRRGTRRATRAALERTREIPIGHTYVWYIYNYIDCTMERFINGFPNVLVNLSIIFQETVTPNNTVCLYDNSLCQCPCPVGNLPP